MNKTIKKIKQFFKKNTRAKKNQTEKPAQNQQEEVKKRLKSLGYFED